jgi:hypothetical protein
MKQEATPLDEAAARARFAALLLPAVGEATFQAARDPDTAAETGLAERAARRIDQRESARQARIERIIGLAAAEFAPVQAEIPADSAWLSRFFERAQDAESEAEQEIWARLLAQELAEPGACSKRALDFLGAMDAWELAGFAEYCAFAFAFESGWRFMFDEDSARREMWAYGRESDFSQHFIAIGLLSAETGAIKPRSARGLRLCYQGRTYELRDAAASLSGASSSGLAYRKFTPIGQQLAGAVRAKSRFGYARNLLKTLGAERGLEFALIEEPDGGQT